MKKILLLILVAGVLSGIAFGQGPPLLKRTTYKTDKLDFGSGGSLVVVGAPVGSVTIEGWQQNQIEVSATIELQAPTESDLDKLSAITGFVLEESLGRTGVVTTGSHDKKLAKKLGKKFAKTLAMLPFRVDYLIKVPLYSDIEVNGGKGNVSITGVEGAHRVNYLESDVTFNLVGGSLLAVIGKGNVEIIIPSRAWRGRSTEVQLASGTMDVRLPTGLNAELDATVLRTGKIENSLNDLKPRVRKGEFTDKSIVAKSGIGGISLKFTVGDGTLKLSRLDGGN